MLAQLDTYHTAARVNVQPYGSALGEFDINCFVQGDVASFKRVHPEKTGSGVKVQPGTVIVREVLGDAGQVAKLTVMAKAPAGFDPSLGDWWFGVTDTQGIPLVDNGAPLVGRLQQCHECHLGRASDDFLFGVPAADETP
jgi:hypothetical protein